MDLFLSSATKGIAPRVGDGLATVAFETPLIFRGGRQAGPPPDRRRPPTAVVVTSPAFAVLADYLESLGRRIEKSAASAFYE